MERFNTFRTTKVLFALVALMAVPAWAAGPDCSSASGAPVAEAPQVTGVVTDGGGGPIEMVATLVGMQDGVKEVDLPATILGQEAVSTSSTFWGESGPLVSSGICQCVKDCVGALKWLLCIQQCCDTYPTCSSVCN